MGLIDKVRATMKCQETEGPFELYVTRTPGYLWACLFKWLGIHPITITLTSIVIGAASGWFFYPHDLKTNLIGITLLIGANWLDCADGQLARMTNKRTLIGRILDGFAGDIWFFVIYVAFCLRTATDMIPFTQITWGPWIWLLAAWAGLHCHAHQCSLGDRLRNIHMYFKLGKEKAELDDSRMIKSEMRALRWNWKEWFQKLYLFFYARYTAGQERQTKAFHLMKQKLEEKYGDHLPEEIREDFCKHSRPIMPLANLLSTDLRMMVMFLCIIIGQVWIYFLFEATVLEALRHYTINRYENLCKRITKQYT